jgi:meiotically up-regulated gene 157 (Mug157) protein
MMDDGTSDYYYAHDHLYSTAALTDSAGDVIERYEYDAYGNVHIMDGNYIPSNFKISFFLYRANSIKVQ